MSETSTSLLISAGILLALTLSDPVINSIFAMLRRTAQRQIEADDFKAAAQQSESYKRDAA
jgi:hypothetical protein